MIKPSVVQSMKLQILKEIHISNMIIIKETILTLCYGLPLKGFRVFAVSRRVGFPYI
jgi:hypothetical protein